MSRSIRRRWFGVSAVAAAILCTALVGTAFAAGSSISKVGVPANAKVNKQFSVTIKGHAGKQEKLFLFLDFFSCARNPAGETAHHAPGVSGTVKGNFSLISKHWKSGKAGKVHACTYLVASGSVVAHHFASFRIH